MNGCLRGSAFARFGDRNALARGVASEKIGVVPNGVDAREFSPRPRPARLAEKYGLVMGSFIIENVSVPPEVEAAIDKRSGMAAVGNLNDFVKYQMAKGFESGQGAGGAGTAAELAVGFGIAQQMMQQGLGATRVAARLPHRDEPLAVVVDERAAAGARVERPSLAVQHEAFLVLLRRDLPELLDADPVFLRIDAVAQIESLHQLLRERPAATLGEQRVLRDELHAGLIVALVRAVASNTHVAGRNAAHRAAFGVENLRRRESG